MTDSATETRCPACHTVFAVEVEDLARAGGKVRCGECMHVFDALAHATTPAEPQGTDDVSEAAVVDHDASDDALTEAAPPEDLTDTAFDVGEDLAANIDDEQFTATNWFIVDEAGDLAPIDATTNDAEAPDDEGELIFGSDPEPDPDDSGAFRFGDDTPPDTLRAELAALVGEALVEDNEDNVEQEEDGIAALSDDAPEREPEAPVAMETTESEPEGDWDDLLGELDGALEAGSDVDLDFELVDADEAGNETSVDLDLTRATGQTSQPDFELPDDALMSATSISTPALSLPAEGVPDTGTELTLEGEAETEAESALSLDAAADETPSEITLEAESDAMSALTLEPQAPVELSLEADGAPEPEPEPEPESEPEPEPEPESEPPSALELEVASAERALDAVSEDAFDSGALDDLMAAAKALDTDDLELEADATVGGDASDYDASADEAEAETEQPVAEATAGDDVSTAGTVGEDTINAMADGERGEVIVLGGDDTPAQEVASAAAAVSTDPPPASSEELEDDPSFAESMIISPDLAPKAPRRTGLWLTLSLLALIGLAAQAVHTWRNTLVTQPYFEDVLPTVYGTFGIDLVPAWDIRQWCVETSGALASEAGLDVESVFSNRGDAALPLPVIKVRIVDAYSDTLAATVIEPRDYLSGAVPERIAPGGRITALARLDYNEPRLDGYEVSLCYAGEDGALRCGTGCPGDD